MGLLGFGNKDGALVTASKIKAKAQMKAIKEDNRQSKAQENLRRAEIEAEDNQRRREHWAEQEQREQEKLDEIKSIELDPTNKEALIKSLSELSGYVGLREKRSFLDGSEEHLDLAKEKFDMGVSMLRAIDPTNPMLSVFLERETKKEMKKKKGKEKKKKIALGCLTFIIVVILLALLGSLFD